MKALRRSFIFGALGGVTITLVGLFCSFVYGMSHSGSHEKHKAVANVCLWPMQAAIEMSTSEFGGLIGVLLLFVVNPAVWCLLIASPLFLVLSMVFRKPK